MNTAKNPDGEALFYCPSCGQQNQAESAALAAGIQCRFCHTGFIPEKVVLLPSLPGSVASSSKSNWRLWTVAIIGGVIIMAGVFFAIQDPLSDARETLGSIGLLLLVGVIYILPAYIARQRGHRNREAITVLNILAGWTVLGWIIALVWAYTNPPTHAQ
jgi:hypothetical protein